MCDDLGPRLALALRVGLRLRLRLVRGLLCSGVGLVFG